MEARAKEAGGNNVKWGGRLGWKIKKTTVPMKDWRCERKNLKKPDREVSGQRVLIRNKGAHTLNYRVVPGEPKGKVFPFTGPKTNSHINSWA